MAFFVSGSSSGSFGQITVDGDIVPKQAETYDLGTSDKPFRDLHVSSGSIKMYAGTEEIARIQVSDDDEFEFFSTKGLSKAQKRTFTKAQIRANATPGKFRGGNIGNPTASTGSFFAIGIGTTQAGRPLHSFRNIDANGVILGRFENPSGEAIIEIISQNNTLGILQFGDPEDANPGAIQYDHSGNSMRFKTADAERLRITSDGNVGIGTTDPSAISGNNQLHLHRSDSSHNYIHFTNGTTGVTNSDGFKVGINGGEQAVIWNNRATDLVFGTSNTQRMTIATNGRVGIGSTVPTAQLDVNGSVSVQGVVTTTSHIKLADGSNFYLDGGSNTYIKQSASDVISFYTAGIERFNTDYQGITLTANNSFLKGKMTNNAVRTLIGLKSNNTIGIGHSGQTVFFENNVTIEGGGDVGIGVTNPAVLLHLSSSSANQFRIERSGTTNAAAHFKNASDDWYAGITSQQDFSISQNADIASGTEFRIQDSTGYVGIGTTTMAEKLAVVGGNWNTSLTIKGGASTSGIKFLDSDNNVDGYIYASGGQIGFMDPGGDFGISIKDDTYIDFAIGAGVSRMRIKSNGNVGIGTTNPDTPLDVHGVATVDGNGGQAQLKLRADAGDGQAIYFTNAASGYEGALVYDNTGTTTEFMHFNVNQATRASVDASGNLIATNDLVMSNSGKFIRFGGTSADTRIYGDSSNDLITLVTGGSERVRINNTGVGIGVSNPNYTLEVGGNMGINGALIHNGDGDTYIQFSTNTIGFYAGNTSSTPDLTIKNNTISGSATSTGSFGQIVVGGGTFTSASLAAGGSGGGGGGSSVWSTSGNKIYYNTDNVGIGTANPSETLHLYSSTNVEPTLKLESGTTGNQGAQLEFVNSGTDADDNDIIGTIRFKGMNDADEETEYCTIYNRSIDVSNGSEDSEMHFRTITAGTLDTTMILQSGKVGIGTTAPDHQLQVHDSTKAAILSLKAATNKASIIELENDGTGYSIGHDLNNNGGHNFFIYDRENTASRLFINSTGNVGIGTANPSSTRRLHIHNTDDTRGIYVYNSSATSYAEIHIQANREFRIGTGGASSAAEAQNNFYVYDATAAAHRFTINSSGDVGIGQTSPTTKLHVKSNDGLFLERAAGTYGLQVYADGAGSYIKASANDLQLWTGSTPSEKMRILQGGNVGIGTIVPADQLVVDTSNANGVGGFIRVSNKVGGAGSTVGINFATFSPEHHSAASSDTTAQIRAIDVGSFAGRLDIRVRGTTSSGVFANVASFTNDAKVGIGETSPSSTLHVKSTTADGHIIAESTHGTSSGVVDIRSVAGRDSFIIFREGTTAKAQIFNDASNDAVVLTDGANLNTIHIKGGRVGIGTATPDNHEFHVHGNSIVGNPSVSNSTTFMEIRGYGAVGKLKAHGHGISTLGARIGDSIMLEAETSAAQGLVLASANSSAPMRFFTNSTERISILSSGNVGINNTSPQRKLDVSNGASGIAAHFGGTSSVSNGIIGGISFGYFESNNVNYRKAGIIQEQIGDSHARGDLHLIVNTTGGQANATAADARLTIDGLTGDVLFPVAHQKISGSSTSTGSFGKVVGSVDIPAGKSLRTSRIRGRSPISIDAEGDNINVTGSIVGSANVDVIGRIFRSNAHGSNAGLVNITQAVNHGVIDIYSSGAGHNIRLWGGGSSYMINRFGIGHNAPENGGLDIRANHSLGQFSVGDGSGNIYHRYYVSMSGAFGNGTAHHVPRGVPGSGTSNFTTHFKSAVGGGTTNHHVIIDGNVGIGTTGPAHELHLEGNEPTLRHYDTATDKYFDIQVGTGGGVSKYKISSEAASNTLVVGNNARVGINQGTAAYNLDISANSGNVEARLYRNANVKSSLRFQNSVRHWEIGNSVVTNNDFAIYDHTNSRELFTLSDQGVIFNEGSANVDFRVESNNNANTLFIKGSNDRVGIGTNDPEDDLHIKNGNHAGGHAFGSKALSLTTSYNSNAQLAVNLTAHRGCYVKCFIQGDWSAHSTIAYLGEFFLQNGAGSYKEPGMIIRQTDNTHDTDSVEAQIVDPAGSGTRDFVIQFKLNGSGTATGYLQYEVMGFFNSIT